jgi:hypothetical protein
MEIIEHAAIYTPPAVRSLITSDDYVCRLRLHELFNYPWIKRPQITPLSEV